jgi:long-chain acyl-CoA synthetase
VFQSIVHLLLKSVEDNADRPALLHRRDGAYEAISYRAFGERVENLTHGLAALGLRPGDPVAILSSNRVEWPIADFAILALRGLSVPIHTALPKNQIEFILRDSGAKGIFVENRSLFDKVVGAAASCPELRHILCFDPIENDGRPLPSFATLLELGREHQKQDPDFFRKTVDAIDPNATCSLVYTSGTTGESKGVMLHHRGFLHTVVQAEAIFGLRDDDVFLSFLPLSHLFERVAGHWCPLYRGAAVAYAENVSTVIRDLQIVRPTVMVSVPRVFEKLRSSVVQKVEASPALRRRLFAWAFRVGSERQESRREGRRGLWLAARYRLADRLVLRKIRGVLGGRFRFPISGGAPLSTDTLRFFGALGIDVVEGYGMTETHPAVTLTPPGRIRIGSCGRPFPGIEVKIADDGEVFVRGPTIMAGYYGRDDLTREAIDRDGWLHTGDIGRLDDDGYLYITDRKKNLIITAGGKNVAPAPIENDIRTSPFIEDVCLVGDRRKFIAAAVVPAWDAVSRWAEQQGLGGLGHEELARHPALTELMLDEIRQRQSAYAEFERVRKCCVLAEPLSVERGELTPTLKMKRRVIEEHFRDQLERLYAS